MLLAVCLFLAFLVVYGAQIVGPVLGADGTTPATGRQAKTGDAVVSQGHGKYYEPASRGALFASGDAGAGVAVTVSITTTATATLHNPLGSGKILAVKKISITYFSGTLPAGSFYHGYAPIGSALPSSGSTPAVSSTALGSPLSSTAVGIFGTARTVASGTVLYPFASSLPVLASTANNPFTIQEDVDGAIVIYPGGQYQLLGVFGGAGSSPKVSVGMLWEEIPIQ